MPRLFKGHERVCNIADESDFYIVNKGMGAEVREMGIMSAGWWFRGNAGVKNGNYGRK